MHTEATLKAQKKAFAKRFKTARIAAGMSQVKLAKLTGISNSTLSNYEVGKTLPSGTNVKKLVRALPVMAASLGIQAGPAKPSLIEEVIVSTESAKAAFTRALFDAAPGVRALMGQASRAGISQADALDMLGVVLEK